MYYLALASNMNYMIDYIKTQQLHKKRICLLGSADKACRLFLFIAKRKGVICDWCRGIKDVVNDDHTFWVVVDRNPYKCIQTISPSGSIPNFIAIMM